MFKTVHLALPVRDLRQAIAFFEVMFDASVLFTDPGNGTGTVAYDQFEYSLFEIPGFDRWTKEQLGPFHIGHELESRDDIDQLYDRAIRAGVRITCKPFERADGDYAFFVEDAQGIKFEFFCGGHATLRRQQHHE